MWNLHITKYSSKDLQSIMIGIKTMFLISSSIIRWSNERVSNSMWVTLNPNWDARISSSLNIQLSTIKLLKFLIFLENQTTHCLLSSHCSHTFVGLPQRIRLYLVWVISSVVVTCTKEKFKLVMDLSISNFELWG